MNKQDVYYALVKAALVGTFPCVDKAKKGCRYIHGDKRCALGIFLPDNPRIEPLEFMAYEKQTPEFKFWFKSLLSNNFSDWEIISIQRIHDNLALSPQGWDTGTFIKTLNELSCFKDVQKYEEKPSVSIF